MSSPGQTRRAKPIMHRELEQSLLGREVGYPQEFDVGLLHAISRVQQRSSLPVAVGATTFVGADEWTAWELSWLGPRGRPEVAVAHITVPADSPNLIESKSLKLYLNGCAQTRFAHIGEVRERIATDLTACSGATVAVDLTAGSSVDHIQVVPLTGIDLDRLDIEIGKDGYGPPQPDLLRTDGVAAPVEECLYTRLFRSNCPVTGQPDWADVQIRYRGMAIDQAGLLRYLIGFRRERDFHEHCVERIYLDLQARCQPEALCVLARFTRRGGIDINPWRASNPALAPPPGLRSARQ